MNSTPRRIRITIALLAALGMLNGAGCWNASPTMRYSDLLKQIEADNVSRVQISENWATVQLGKAPEGLETDRTEHLVMLPAGDMAREKLERLLAEHYVNFEISP